MHLLILGGTGFTGPHQVREALARGHRVTVFNRGQSRPTRALGPGVEQLVGDRDRADYRALQGRRFDVCIDNASSVPHRVRDAAAVLRGQVGHFICISTISVYADQSRPGQDESAPRLRYSGDMDPLSISTEALRANMALYGPLKALVEDEAQAAFAGACTVVRPGLIVGPGDETDRFSYWPLRLLRGGPVLVPPLADRVSWIDARDLAEWTVRLAETRQGGVFNAVGPASPVTMGDLLGELRDALGSSASWVEASAESLAEQGVQPWSDLPVWLPSTGDTAGLHHHSHAAAVAAGLRFRPVAQTALDFIVWWQAQTAERRAAPLRAGLSAAREADLIGRLAYL